jgi:hypothetical protein
MEKENREKGTVIMLSTSDLIHLPYTPDLTEGGIACACRSLAFAGHRMGDAPVEQLRHTVADTAIELAFRRYLSTQAVPFQVFRTTPFTHPDRYDISLGRHRCVLNSCLITRRNQITQLRRDPASLLQWSALVPVDQFAAEGHKPDDLYLFAFLLGVVAAAQEDIEKAVASHQPLFLIHLLPHDWVTPVNWIPFENLAMKSECGTPVTVDIGGQDAERSFITTTLELLPRQRRLVENGFHSLAYVHARRRPEARIGIHSPRHGEPYLIPAHAWRNLWIYGMDIILTGWLTHEEYRRKAKVLNPGARTFQMDQMRLKNLSVPIGELNPLGRLLEKVRQWEAERTRLNPSS